MTEKNVRRSRWVARTGGALAGLLILAGFIYGPRVLRDAETFRVRQVEVVGARYLEPYSVVRAAGLDRPASVFDDADAWRAGVLTLPLVADVRVRRTLPGTVTLEVREDEPVALVAAGTLRPVDGAGRLLELDPAGAMLDLPVLSGVTLAGATVAGGESAAAVATVARLLRRAPAVAERLSQAHLSGGRLRLSFRDSRAEALLPPAATDVQVTQLRLAVADLAARGELESVQTIDVRFHDQVVVSFGRRTVS